MDKTIYYTIFFLYISWIILFILGMIWIIKQKLWKPENYFTISIIFFAYVIIFYQIRIMYICSPYKDISDYTNGSEGYTNNINTMFTLYDRQNELPIQIKFAGGDAPTLFDWTQPLNYGVNKGHDIYNSDKDTVCKKKQIIQLTELASVATQQLQDASAAYYSLVKVYQSLTGNSIIPSTC